MRTRMRCGLIAATMATTMLAVAGNAVFRDPLDTPSTSSPGVAQAPLLAITSAGDALVAVGLRGTAAYSRDQGANWKQASVPVGSDLVAVQFPTPQQGWASGHDGVILHSSDGGVSWTKQLDGRKAGALTLAYYQAQVQQGVPEAEAALRLAAQNYRDGPDLPFLGVWFDDAQHGFAVGSFGLLLATNDGGRSWEPWLHRIDNPDGLNLNAIRGIGGQVYIAAERGTIFKLDRAAGRFVAIHTDYTGSFLDLVGEGGTLLAFGLRGRAYRSADAGQSWSEVATGLDTGITAATVLPGGRFVLVSQGGQAVLGNGADVPFAPLKIDRPGLFTGVALAGPGTLVLTAFGGASRQPVHTGTH